MKKDDKKAQAAPPAKKKKGTSPALKAARDEIEKKKKALKNANAKKREAQEELDSYLADRALRFGAGFGGGLAAGAITEGLKGSKWGDADPEGDGFFDSDLKAALIPAAGGLLLAVVGGGNGVADAAAMGMANALAVELGKEGVRKVREKAAA
jgi:hypothetical protein